MDLNEKQHRVLRVLRLRLLAGVAEPGRADPGPLVPLRITLCLCLLHSAQWLLPACPKTMESKTPVCPKQKAPEDESLHPTRAALSQRLLKVDVKISQLPQLLKLRVRRRICFELFPAFPHRVGSRSHSDPMVPK